LPPHLEPKGVVAFNEKPTDDRDVQMKTRLLRGVDLGTKARLGKQKKKCKSQKYHRRQNDLFFQSDRS